MLASAFAGEVNIIVTGGGSAQGGNATNALAEGPGGIYDASLQTNLNGAAIQPGTVSSNALDAATRAMFGGGGGDFSTNAAWHDFTNNAQPWANYLTVATYNAGWGALSTNVLTGLGGVVPSGLVTNNGTAGVIAPSGSQIGGVGFTNDNVTAGTVTATNFIGSGAGLTGVVASSTNNMALVVGCLIYPDTNHTCVIYTNGTQSSVHTFPSSGSCGINEVKALIPFSTNGYAAGSGIRPQAGDYYPTVPIRVTNLSVISPMWGHVVFNYSGPTNGFTYANLTNAPASVALFSVVSNNVPSPPGSTMYPDENIALSGFTVRARTNAFCIGVYTFANNLYCEKVAVGGSMLLAAPTYHAVFVQKGDVPEPSRMIGFWVQGSTVQKFVDCGAYGVADGLVIDGNVYAYITDFACQAIGRYADADTNAFPLTSELSMGAGVMITKSSAAYHVKIDGIMPYQCRTPAYFSVGMIDVVAFDDQDSLYPIAIFENATPTPTADVSIKTKSYLAAAGGDITDPAANAVIAVTNDAAGNYFFDTDFTLPVLCGVEAEAQSLSFANIGGHYWWRGNDPVFGYSFNGHFTIYFPYILYANGGGLTNISPSHIVNDGTKIPIGTVANGQTTNTVAMAGFYCTDGTNRWPSKAGQPFP